MLVIADASPLNYLVWIDAVWILPKLHGVVIIPPVCRRLVSMWVCNPNAMVSPKNERLMNSILNKRIVNDSSFLES